MLRSLLSMTGYGVGATDGDLGVVRDFYLDDETWMIRFIVVGTGGGAGRRVLLSPTLDCCRPDWNLQLLHVGLTIKDVMNSPDVNTEQPVSKEQAQLMRDYYTSMGMAVMPESGGRKIRPSSTGNSHLRSFEEIRSYKVNGIDGPAGRAHDLIVNEVSWEVRYIVVSRPAPSLSMGLVSIDWVTSVSWADQMILVDLPMESLRLCPEYDPSAAVYRDFENRVYDYHGRPKPWDATTESAPEELNG